MRLTGMRMLLAAPLLLVAMTDARAGETANTEIDVCHFIAEQQMEQTWQTQLPGTYGVRGDFLTNYFVRYGWFDLDGDGIAEHVTKAETNGTIGGDAYDYSLSSVHKTSDTIDPADLPAAVLPQDIANYLDDNRPSFGEAFLPFKGRFYDVNFTDEGGAFVLDALYYRRGGAQRAACVFKNQVTLSGWSPANSPPQFKTDRDVVWELADKSAIAANPIAASSALEKAAPAADHSIALPGGSINPACKFGRGDCKDLWTVDFDNDGIADRLVLLSGNSGAGRGCDVSFFMLLAADGKIAQGVKQDLLLKLQNVRLDDAYPVRPCGLEFRWLKVAGRVVLKRRSAHQPPQDSSELVDDLWIARNGRTARLAYAEFKVTPEILYDAAPEPAAP